MMNTKQSLAVAFYALLLVAACAIGIITGDVVAAAISGVAAVTAGFVAYRLGG